MSRNPNYTGNQTFTIPATISGLFGNGLVAMPKNGTNLKQDIANQKGSLPELMRPKNESWVNNYQPIYNAPTKEVYNLEKEAKRRSADIELK